MPSQSLLSLPGYQLAKDHGFSVHSTSGDKSVAKYTKDGIHMTATHSAIELSFFSGLLAISTGEFSHNADFDMFYRQVVKAKNRLDNGATNERRS